MAHRSASKHYAIPNAHQGSSFCPLVHPKLCSTVQLSAEAPVPLWTSFSSRCSSNTQLSFHRW
uniref:Uncharacterized protein n=1 Tax=Arundo donax TaxID=35708 RepID=A0A0A8ZPL2_ARUDO